MKKTIDTILKHQWWNGISGIISLGSVIGVLIGAIIHFNKDIEKFIKEGDFFDKVYDFKDLECKAKIDFNRVFRKYRKSKS